MSLAEVLGSHRVVVTVGSGGVGKTTTAAAMAVQAAMDGRKVLCLTIDPARRLANSLGLDEMTTSEQDVPNSLFESHGLRCNGSLSAMMLDTKRTFDDLVERHASSADARDRILNNQIYKYVASSLAGTQEYMAMEKLHEVRKDPTWDLVVLDTPPTASALDFLTAPERLIDAIDSPAMRWFLQVFEGAGKEAFGLVGRGATVLLRGIGKITGIEFLEQVAEFVSGINDLFGGFKERAEQVSNALRSPEVAFVLVTSPDPLAIGEARFFSDKLQDAGMKREAIIINQVHTLIPKPEISEEAQVAELRAALPESIDAADILPRLSEALTVERRWAMADRAEVERLNEQVGSDAGIVEVPAFDEDVHDLAALAKVASFLTISS
ncbi:MAG: AAA family ATPase [Deltaproteobacteria bacterium]|nr:AAA family ATPase [Deltaproteobacteria bacterium]NND30434.1 ArsA family ATPase [Myxococcales bacterium]MBT8466791.1 AAA family ATPase [Deltaproteobacteria bacterium]MBT8483825.1 AAA family ATPase [Deltaproteobacteria bacterium]NNK09358.1 ArsA family ATPase [Myxococcales bacterium]